MKICVYIPTASFFVGGGEIVPLMQAKFLSKIDNTVTVVALKVQRETPYFKNFKSENTNINFDYIEATYSIDDIPYERRKVDHELGHDMYFNLSRSFEGYCIKNDFDVVITHYAPAAISVPKNIKQVLFLHGVPDVIQTINRVAVNVADCLVAVSQSVADGWSDLYKVQNINTIHNGIDQNHFIKQDIQKDIDVFYVGRLIEIKGVQFLIGAIKILSDQGVSLNVAIAGKGPYEETLKELVVRNKLENRIKFVGFISDNELVNYYNRSKIVVLPSYSKEGVLTTLLEASACQTCVMTSNCCGMKEFVQNGITGLLSKPKNPTDIANKIKSLINNPDKIEKLGKNARKEIEAHWTWDKSANKLNNLIKELLQK